MKASELVTLLQDFIKNYGDCDMLRQEPCCCSDTRVLNPEDVHCIGPGNLGNNITNSHHGILLARKYK